MATVQSWGELARLSDVTWQSRWVGGSQHRVPLYGVSESVGQLYATQPNVRKCVDFLSASAAQIGIHAFRRVSDTDRVRLATHEVIRWLEYPSPDRSLTRYRLIENLMSDLALYFNAFWLKVPWFNPLTGEQMLGLLRLPPEEVYVEGGLMPVLFRWTRFGVVNEYTPDQIVFFNGYNPLNQKLGLSPLYTLRRILAEEQAAGDYREAFWRNGARFEGIIERPASAPRWNKDQRESWRTQWQERFAGGGADAGQTVVLEDGMTYKPNAWSARDAEFIAGRKLTLTQCAGAWRIPPPFVGDLEHATFSNITEQHKNLYQDTLAPWLEMIEQAIESQLLPEATDTTNVYLEFNIADKMKGSFEEQASSLQALVGRPIMTANEGRARLNLPAIDDPSADTLAPQQGGPASTVNIPAPPLDQTTAASVALVLDATARRQRTKLEKVPVRDRAAALLATQARWTRELATDLAAHLKPEHAQQCAALHYERLLAALYLEAIHDW